MSPAHLERDSPSRKPLTSAALVKSVFVCFCAAGGPSPGGREIDRANAVYRMNFAPMRNYRSDVGARTHTQCVNPEKMRLQLRENKAWKTDVGERPKRVFVVGDIPGTDASGASGPCIDRSQGGLCTKRTTDTFVKSLDLSVSKLTEELLYTLQEGVGEEDGVPTTGKG